MIFERTVKNIPVEYFLAMERNHGFPILWPSFPSEGESPVLPIARESNDKGAASAATGKTLQAFFMSALCAQKSLAACGRRLKREFVETRDEPRVSRGDSASCGMRLRALP